MNKAFRKRNNLRTFKVNKSIDNRVMFQCATNVNKDAIRRESINGIEHIIITSMTLPDNIVMNGGLYPAEEIKASFHTLDRTLAPVEHPQNSEGEYISAYDGEAVNNFHVGAYNANVEQIKGRVKVDKIINVQVAMGSEKGRRLLDRINELEVSEDPRPIHTSVGVWLTVNELKEPATNEHGQEYTWVAEDMVFDHDAILLDSVGAAQPGQGVGMAVNKGRKLSVNRFELDAVRAARNLPLADTDTTWDSGAAIQRVREKIGAAEAPNAAYARYHLWVDAENSEEFGAYKLPFVDVIDGELKAVPNALRNAAARLNQVDGPSDAERTTIKNIIDGYLDRIRTNAQGPSMSERVGAIEEALESQAVVIQYIEEVYEEEVIFYSGETLFTVPYRIDEAGTVSIVGIPVPVDRVVTYTPKTNAQKGDEMREIIINDLKAKGIEVNEEMTDAELKAKYDEVFSANQSGDDEGASSEGGDLASVVANAMKPVTEKLESLEAKLNEKDDAEVERLAGIIANSGKYPGLDAESAKALSLDKLKEMAANCGHAFGIIPTMQTNQGDAEQYQAPTEAPE